MCTVSYGSEGTHSITARYSGDSNFNGSISTPEPVSAVPIPADVAGIIAATMQWTFNYGPSYTEVLAFVVNGLPPSATVSVTCHGRGCPIARAPRHDGAKQALPDTPRERQVSRLENGQPVAGIP